MKLLVFIATVSSFGLVLGGPIDDGTTVGTTLSPVAGVPPNNTPHAHHDYHGLGAYGGLGFAGPFHGPDFHKLNEGIKCAGTELKLTDTLNQTMKECHDKVYTDWEAAGNKGTPSLHQRACGIVCTVQGLGLLDKVGKPVHDEISAHIQKVYPAEVTEELKAALKYCGDQYAQAVEIKDGSCETFEKFIGCVKSNVRRICYTEHAGNAV